MALELPGWVVIAFNYAGLPWPGIDEDELREWAASVRTFAGNITGNSARTHQVVAGLADSSQSSFTSTLAARWEHHNQLIADLHEPLNVFADALDVAADVVVAQKLVVIGAAVAFATEFAATQVGAFLTLGADEAALPEEIISTREIIDFAIEELKGALIGELVNGAVQEISDHINSFIGNLLTGGLQVVTEYQSLKISYSALRETAQSIRGQADETQQTGDTAYAENANRDIEDPGEAESTDGGWAAVVQAVKQALLDLALSLFKSLPQVILRAQEDAVEDLGNAAEIVSGADRTAGQDAPHDSAPGPAPEPAVGPMPSGAGTSGPDGAEPSVRYDSRGRVIPPGVERLPSGWLPANFEYAGKHYDGVGWTAKMAEKYPDGVWFTPDGFPDFSPYAIETVTFDPNFRGNHGTDFNNANKRCGLERTPRYYTWHHHQDGRTMQLIPKDLHKAVRHAGGVAITKGRT